MQNRFGAQENGIINASRRRVILRVMAAATQPEFFLELPSLVVNGIVLEVSWDLHANEPILNQLVLRIRVGVEEPSGTIWDAVRTCAARVPAEPPKPLE